MLSARRLKFLSLALLMSGGTVVLTQQWLQGAVRQAAAEARAKAAPAAQAPATRVLVAATELPAGALLKPENLRWQSWPADAPVQDYFTQSSARIDDLAGAVIRNGVAAGEPLNVHRVVKLGDRSFLAAVLQPGYRAVTVNVNAAAGVAGFAMPGDHVDLILSRPLDGSGNQRRFVSETVLKDIRVVAVDQRGLDGKKDVLVPQTATLEVTPKGAEVIAVAAELGKLSLSLRSLGAADAPVSEARVVTRTLDHDATQSAVARAAAPARPAPKPRATPAGGVQVFRGTETFTVGAASTPGVTP